ncbi:MAG: class I SAM-dependent methyltransferase [Methanothrix sp.]|nr:class I SAM-dependent methyltransferase [Methanothrix sp.]
MSRSANYQNPKFYWERRLEDNFNLIGVGHASLGSKYNSLIYKARVDALEKALCTTGIKFQEQKILEIGCGTGFFTGYCQIKNVNSYTGLDITEISVRSLSEQFPGYRFFQADIGDSSLPLNEQFDNILIADVLYHIVDDVRFATAISHVGNLLLPNGNLILSDLITGDTYDTSEHCKWRSLANYRDLLSINNMQVVHIEPIFSLLTPPPIMPNSSLAWKIYALIWRYAFLRVTHQHWFDDKFSAFLRKLDENYFLRHAGIDTPNSKWLIAHKEYVG